MIAQLHMKLIAERDYLVLIWNNYAASREQFRHEGE